MIKLLQLFPDHLNLNGDAGNLLVLQRRAEWGGIAVNNSELALGQSPAERPDVVLIGHGSPAAWRQAYPALKKLTPTLIDWISQGAQILAISSGFAALHGLLPSLPNSVVRIEERFSNFVVDDYEGKSLVGYKNTDLDLANLHIEPGLIGSLLHGPLLAKNAWLADQILSRIVAERPELKANRGAVQADKFSQAVVLVNAAVELATEIAAD